MSFKNHPQLVSTSRHLEWFTLHGTRPHVTQEVQLKLPGSAAPATTLVRCLGSKKYVESINS
jgi:hypothetical protein